MSQNEENNKHILKKCCNFGIVSFSIALIVGTVLGAMIFLRPTVSENEYHESGVMITDISFSPAWMNDLQR